MMDLVQGVLREESRTDTLYYENQQAPFPPKKALFEYFDPKKYALMTKFIFFSLLSFNTDNMTNRNSIRSIFVHENIKKLKFIRMF